MDECELEGRWKNSANSFGRSALCDKAFSIRKMLSDRNHFRREEITDECQSIQHSWRSTNVAQPDSEVFPATEEQDEDPPADEDVPAVEVQNADLRVSVRLCHQ